MSVKERLISYTKLKKLSLRGFSLSIGMSENYISSMRNSIQPDVVHNIAEKYTDLNMGWLMTGDGKMLKHEVQTEYSNKEIIHMEDEKITDFERFNKVVYYLIKHGLVRSQEQLAQELGHIEKVLLDIGKGKRPLKISLIHKLCELYKVINPDYLLSGNVPMLLSELPDLDSPGKSKVKNNTTPYFPDINASAGLDFLSDNGHNHSIPISIPNVDAEAFINVFGDSMYPKFCSGEIIGIKQIQKDMVFFGHAYVVEMIDNEAYLKYINAGSDRDHWILASENTMYQPQEFHLEKIRKIFIIKAVISKITLL